MAEKLLGMFLSERLTDKAILLPEVDAIIIGRHNSSSVLTPVLEGEKTIIEVAKCRLVLIGEKKRKDAAHSAASANTRVGEVSFDEL
jgi:hypothetical protein